MFPSGQTHQSDSFATELLKSSDQSLTDIVLPHGFLQCCMPQRAKGFLKLYEDMVELLLMLHVILSDTSDVEYLF